MNMSANQCDGTSAAKKRAEYDMETMMFLPDVSREVSGSNPSATGSTPVPACSPTWNAYRVEIPEGYQVLCQVFLQEPPKPNQSEKKDALSVLNAGFQKVRSGILLCRSEVDAQTALQEFRQALPRGKDRDGFDLSALTVGETRQAYRVLALEEAKSCHRGPILPSERIVLVPLVTFGAESRPFYHGPAMIVDPMAGLV